jgi:hypothetical protein
MFQASQVRPSHTAGRYGDARIGDQIKIACSPLVGRHWFSRPGSVRSFAHTGHRSPHIADAPHRRGQQTAPVGSLWSSSRTSVAQSMRAILLASAIATSMRGFRASIRASHDPGRPPPRPRQWTINIAPTISRRRMSRCPIFEVRPSFCLPPLECYRGTRPSQAAKSRPLRNSCKSAAKAVIAIAQTGPIPGMVWSL